MKRKKSRLITKLIVAGLVLYALVNLVRLQEQIRLTKNEIEALSVKVEHQKRQNAMLSDSLQVELTDEVIAEIARRELGLVSPGEKIFVDISN